MQIRHSSKEKVVLIIGGLADSLVNFRWPLILALVKHGYRVIGCAAESNDRVRDKFLAIGGDYIPIHLKRAGLNPRDDLLTYIHLRKLIQKELPSIIICYTIKPVIYGLLAGQKTDAKRYALITGLGYAFTEGNKNFLRSIVRKAALKLYRTSLRNATHVFFQNPDDQNLFRINGLLKPETSSSVVNGSGVDTRHFHPVPLPPEPVFLLIARLLVDKGIREYVEAARLLKQKIPNATFLLAGPLDPNPSAVRREELDTWIAEGVIEYLGTLKDVRPAIQQASVYVLPSYREGTPRTVLEAMSMGRPIITTDVPGCRETVQPEYNGLLVKHKDIHDLKNAMEKLAINNELRMIYGRNSRSIAEKKYDANNVASQMLEIIAT